MTSISGMALILYCEVMEKYIISRIEVEVSMKNELEQWDGSYIRTTNFGNKPIYILGNVNFGY